MHFVLCYVCKPRAGLLLWRLCHAIEYVYIPSDNNDIFRLMCAFRRKYYAVPIASVREHCSRPNWAALCSSISSALNAEPNILAEHGGDVEDITENMLSWICYCGKYARICTWSVYDLLVSYGLKTLFHKLLPDLKLNSIFQSYICNSTYPQLQVIDVYFDKYEYEMELVLSLNFH